VGSGSTSASAPDFGLSWLRHFVQPSVHEGVAVPGPGSVVSDTVVGGVLVDAVYVAEVQG
jgi:hypothetical protein